MRRIPAFLVAGTTFLVACGSSGGGATDPGTTADDGADAVETIAIDVPATNEGAGDAALPDAGTDDVLIPVDMTQEDVPVYQDPGGDVPTVGCLATNGHYSNLDGVRIEFTGTECHWLQSQALAGVKVPYQVVIAKDVDLVTPKPQDAGQCDLPGPSGLILFEKLEGDSQAYCKCDTGLCQGTTQTVTLKAGTYPGEFEWHGRNWEGPSDTGNPEGAPFPAGKYTLTVRAKGEAKIYGVKQDFEVSATFTIEISDDPLPELPEPEPDVPAQDFYIPGEPSADDVPLAEAQT